MKQQLIIITLLSALLAFGCSEDNKTTNTAASQNTGTTETDNQQSPADEQQNPGNEQQNPGNEQQNPGNEQQNPGNEQQTPAQSQLQAKIDDTIVTVQWEDNDAVKALKEMTSKSVVTVNMSRYDGVAQVGSLGQSLPQNDAQIISDVGDIVLYSENQIVIYYSTNSWRSTRLGKITDKSKSELIPLLDKPNVTLYLSSDLTGTQTEPAPSEKKSLVAYFSVTHHTEPIAEYISEHTDATLYEIVPEQPYTDKDIDYGDSSSRTSIEKNDPNARPAIASTVDNIEQYDIIYLGYPIWHGQAPKIMYTFLESVFIKDGATIVPFCTSASSGIGSSATNLKQLAPSANWLDGNRFAVGTDKSTVTQWVDSLNLK